MEPLIGGAGLGITQAHADNSPVLSPINGKIVFVAIDASSMAAEADLFAQYVSEGKTLGEVNPDIVFINLAQPAKDINDWTYNNRPQFTNVWNTVTNKIKAAGVTYNDVQVAWIKFEDLDDNGTDNGRIDRVFWKYVDLFHLLKSKFPNLKKVYLSGRSYMPTTDPKFGEPLPGLNQLIVKKVVQEQIAGNPELNFTNGTAPWISDIVLLYTDGYNVRADGYYRTPDSYKTDGIHPSSIGSEQVCNYLYNTLINYSNFFVNGVKVEESGPYSDNTPYIPLDPDEYANQNATGSQQGSGLLAAGVLGFIAFRLLRKRKST